MGRASVGKAGYSGSSGPHQGGVTAPLRARKTSPLIPASFLAIYLGFGVESVVFASKVGLDLVRRRFLAFCWEG
jgi:hypothetical protein